MPLAKPQNASSPVLSHFSLSGKIAAVTGGARGIGLEVVRGLAEAGATVALIYTASKDAEETAKSISQSTGQKIVAYKSDVRSKDTITKTISQIAADFGRLDIVVANAGIASHFDSLDYSEEQWRDIMQVNLDGAMYTAQAAGTIFKKQKEASGKGDGSFIFTASAAVVHLAKCLAVEWMDFGRVNCISPGFIETEMIASHPKEWRDKWSQLVPAGRNADAAELKGAYVFLASDASSYMSGANVVIDGGYTLP
ncbi:hypothetical protein BST61_g4749 [Cercospora zeina]